ATPALHTFPTRRSSDLVRQRVRGLCRAREVRDGSRAQQGSDDLPAAVRHERVPEAADRRGICDDVQRARAGARIEEPEHRQALRSEEHTSELQSLAYLV